MKQMFPWRSAASAFVLFGGLGLVFLLGAGLLGAGRAHTVTRWLTVARGAWGLPLTVAAFAALAFLGAPQFVLIAAAAAAFGPWRGMAYAWIGTMLSSLVGFGLGRRFGGGMFARGEGESAREFARLMARNGFAASLVARLVPFAPFVLVNVAAGMTPMRIADFVAGTAIGIAPKIALTAFAGNALLDTGKTGWATAAGLVALCVAVWLAAAWAARRWLRRRRSMDGG